MRWRTICLPLVSSPPRFRHAHRCPPSSYAAAALARRRRMPRLRPNHIARRQKEKKEAFMPASC